MRRAVQALAALLGAVGTLPAQHAVWTPRLVLDNDAYNFWLHPGRRPDREYSNGVRASVERPIGNWLGRRLLGTRMDCAAATPLAGCLSSEWAIQQDLYTPDLRFPPGTYPGWQKDRPYAGVLVVTAAARRHDNRRLRELELSLGVSGRPSGAELMQGLFHAINRKYTIRAEGWESQIGFEPLLNAGYRERWLAIDAGPRNGLRLQLMPYVGGKIGNLRTAAEGGANLRVGLDLAHPWHPATWATRPSGEVYLIAGGRYAVVGRDLSLDGTLLSTGRSVQRVSMVEEHDFGFGIRVRALRLEYRAVTRGREYETGPPRHSYGSMFAALEYARGRRR